MKKNKYRFRPACEALEDRLAPAQYYFHETVDKNWSTAGNWKNENGVAYVNTTPGPSDHAFILASKEVYFDAGASLTVGSFGMGEGSTLNLGKVTQDGLTLTVNGTAAIGGTGATACTIVANNTAPSVSRNADLVFKGDVSIYNSHWNMFATAGGGGQNRYGLVQFQTRAYVLHNTTLNADVTIGGNSPSLAGQMFVNPGFNKSLSLSSHGSLRVTPLSTLHFKSGSLTRSAGNTMPINNSGTVNVDVGKGNKFDCQPKISGGGKTTVESGELAGHFVPGEAGDVYVWAGTGLDASGEAQEFGAGDHVVFVGDGVDTDPVTLYGDFVFDGATESFTAFAVAKPTGDDLSGWSPGSGGGAISLAVNVRGDDDDNCSWTSISDTTNWQIHKSGGYYHATLDVDGAYSNSYGEFHVTTSGSTPSQNDTVLLVSSSQALSVSNLDHSYAGFAWGVWLPDDEERGLLAGLGQGGGGGGGD